MKNAWLLVVGLALSMMVKAQSSDTKAVLQAVEKLRLAMISADKAELEAIAAPTLSYGHSSGLVEDKATFVASFVSGRSDFITADFIDQTVTITANTALVRHILTGKTNDNGKPGEIRLGVLLVWQKQHKDWKLIGRQAYKLPAANH